MAAEPPYLTYLTSFVAAFLFFSLDDSRVRNKDSCKVRRCQEQRESLGKRFCLNNSDLCTDGFEEMLLYAREEFLVFKR